MDPCGFPECGHELPARANSCPHCGRPGLFPNVRAANEAGEVAALGVRHGDARKDVSARGCAAVADAFEKAVEGSKAVIARPFGEVERLTRNDREVFSTYYRQIEGELRLPDTSVWDPLRRIAEEALFPGYKEDIRFASLTLDERGLASYGECFLVLRSPLIAHRTSVYEENNVIFAKRHDFKLSELVNLPKGYRADWAGRAVLSVAKLGAKLGSAMTAPDFAALLQHAGATTADDDFVEVHIYGPITIRAIEKIVLVKPDPSRAAKAKRRAWKERLKKDYGVTVEEA